MANLQYFYCRKLYDVLLADIEKASSRAEHIMTLNSISRVII